MGNAAITILPPPPVLGTPAEAARVIAEQGGGIAVFARPGLRSLIEAVDGYWREIAQQSFDVKKRLTVAHRWDDPNEGVDNGWVPRHGDRPSGEDVKEFFHFRSPLQTWLKNRRIRLTVAERRYLADSQILHDALLGHMFEFGAALDTQIEGCNFEARLREEAQRPKYRSEHVLRMLHYRPVQFTGQELARRHVDRCLFTFHVADSRPGLVITIDGEEFLVETRPDTVIVFCGKKAPGISRNRLVALPHWVVSPEEAGAAPDRRTSMVFFAHCLTAGSLFDAAGDTVD